MEDGKGEVEKASAGKAEGVLAEICGGTKRPVANQRVNEGPKG